MGHRTTYDIWPDRPGDTDIFVKDLPTKAEKGDLIITNAAASEELLNRLRRFHEQGVFIIGGPRSWGGDCIGSELIIPEIRNLKVSAISDLWIELYETAYGAVVNVPGSPYPMGPSSGGSGRNGPRPAARQRRPARRHALRRAAGPRLRCRPGAD
jgi:hypothetical protein